MPIQVLMPALSPTMEKGNLAKWLKSEGDKVKSGDVIAEIETDKATMEVEAVDEGTLGKILVPEGTADVAVNTPIAVILGEGEDGVRAIDDRQRQAGAAAKKAAECRAAAPSAVEAKPAAAGCSAPPQPQAPPEPDVPEGTEMVTMTVREALRDAMAEEMRRDDDRLRDGRGGRRISGRLQGHAGPAAGVRRAARGRHADHRARLRRSRRRRGARGPEADRRVHDLQLRHAGDGPDHQLGGQDPLHVGRPDELLDRVPRPERRRRARRRPAQPGLFGLVLAHSRA